MHSQFLIALVALIASAGTAAADSYVCQSLNETDFPATASFELRYSSGAYAVMQAEFQIVGDIGYSTTAIDPLDLATVTGVEVTSGSIKFKLHHSHGAYDGDIAPLHVVSLSEGAYELVAGVLQVVGGGLWPISCEATRDS